MLSPTASRSGRDVVYSSQKDYWIGKVWININYLALAALHQRTHTHTPATEPKHTTHCTPISLTSSLHRMRRKGFLFAQYHDKTREGLKHKPFAGWTELVLVIMAEI